MSAQTNDPASDSCQLISQPAGYASLNDEEKSRTLTLQQSILESILEGYSSQDIIDNICRLEEQLLPNSVGTVMLLDRNHEMLNVIAGPSLSDDAREKFSRLRPGPGSGSCGNVIYRNEPVFVSNTLTDPRWADLRHLAQTYQLMACWSMPIRGAGGRIVGTFALSSFENRSPSPFHIKLLEIGASIIGIVLERSEQITRQRLYAHIFNHTGESVLITDNKLRVMSINPVFNSMFGYREEDVIGKQPDFLRSGVHDDDYYRKMWTDLQTTGYWQDEIWNRSQDGEVKPCLLGISVVRDSDNQITHYIGIYTDITRYKQAQAKAEFLTYHDALTRLPNRTLVRDRAELAIASARENRSGLAIMVIDVDHFKNINDLLGHQRGDLVLQEVAQRLQSSLLDSETLSRHTGDEFLALLPNLSDREHINQTLLNIQASMSRSFQADEQKLSITVSVGISVYPDDGSDFDSLLKAADLARHRAKSSGRNNWRYFTEQMNIEAQDRIHIGNELHRALADRQLHLHYQPQIELSNGELKGAEALLRWQHPELGNIPPGHFIPIAEEYGLIIPIGEWVIQEACRQAMAWQMSGQPGFRISVNLSAVQFYRGDLVATVRQALADSRLPPHCLELELTESIMMNNTEQMLHTVNQLKQLGVQLSIDDFGTGYSSLAYLKRFQVDKLKIDQSFVRDMLHEKNDAAIVRAIIQMARSMNLKTIAEGVEDAAQMDLLRVELCDEIQGYHISRPMTAAAFSAWQEHWAAGQAQ